MKKKIKKVEYSDLPIDFWDKVIFYDYFVSFSGLNEIEPHITMWTSDGEKYYINTRELRDGRFERVIPFFEPMADKEKIAKGELHYFDWQLVPEGWNYYFTQSNHCFIPASVFEEFSKNMEEYQNEKRTNAESESVEEWIARLLMWKVLLKKAYEKVLGVVISEDAKTYIRFDEKIHVYADNYDYRCLHIDQITKEDIAKIKRADVWSIEYTTNMEGLWNLIDIVVYFEKSTPFCMSYEFDRKELSNYIDEHEFMEKFMKIIQCNLGNKKSGYSFNNAPTGYSVLQGNNIKVYWIRDDLYKLHYNNVIDPYINYSGNLRFLRSPICGCVENKEGYLENEDS